ncbi:MAG: hypothetical protein IKG94_07505 [Candidatus Methanomethylophilaceae archaeon]|nr:hypothetical protein [Candidatus Methanomethylophilaceae archaeon]
MYSIRDLQRVRHEGGRAEMVVCDGTLELIAEGLEKMGLSLPLKEDDEDAIFEYLESLDIEIGQRESEKAYPTPEYDEQVCRAVDEFNLEDEFIDYDSVNRRLGIILERIDHGTYAPSVPEKWKR